MKKIIILLIFIPLISFSQNLTFIGENSYQSSEEFDFDNWENDLFVTFLKDNDKIMVMLKTLDVLDYKNPSINGKMLVYLDDGKVLSVSKPTYRDYVDNFCISIYPLTKSDVDAIINSNINSIRYALDDKYDDIRNRVATNVAGYPINNTLKDF